MAKGEGRGRGGTRWQALAGGHAAPSFFPSSPCTGSPCLSLLSLASVAAPTSAIAATAWVFSHLHRTIAAVASSGAAGLGSPLGSPRVPSLIWRGLLFGRVALRHFAGFIGCHQNLHFYCKFWQLRLTVHTFARRNTAAVPIQVTELYPRAKQPASQSGRQPEHGSVLDPSCLLPSLAICRACDCLACHCSPPPSESKRKQEPPQKHSRFFPSCVLGPCLSAFSTGTFCMSGRAAAKNNWVSVRRRGNAIG